MQWNVSTSLMVRSMRLSLLPLSCALLAVALTGISFAASDLAQDGFRKVASISVPLDGTRIATPPLKSMDEFAYRLVISGTFHFAYNDKRYDAFYAEDDSGQFRVRHSYVEWSPCELQLVEQDIPNHRYIFALPHDADWTGTSLTVRINIAKFVDDFLITPSEVKASLSGNLTIELWEKPLMATATVSWLWTAPIAIALMLLSFVIQRRSKLRGLETDLVKRIERIREKFNAVIKVLPKGNVDMQTLRQRLQKLCESAVTLAHQLQRFRETERQEDARALMDEVHQLERALESTTDDVLKREYRVTLEQKRKVQRYLEQVRNNQSRYLLRLSRIEAVMDATRLKVEQLKAQQVSSLDIDSLDAEIDAELQLLDEVNRELEQLAALEFAMPVAQSDEGEVTPQRTSQ